MKARRAISLPDGEEGASADDNRGRLTADNNVDGINDMFMRDSSSLFLSSLLPFFSPATSRLYL